MHRFVVISGCSSGGKSTLLVELARRGYKVVEEPGRRIVHEQLSGQSTALPWVDMGAFLRRCVAVALADRVSAGSPDDWIFFDRSLIDAATGLQHLTGESALAMLGQTHRYHHRVFLAPPWPEIYVADPERSHDQACALAEYSRLLNAYSSLRYEVSILPKVHVAERADFILSVLEA
jgi:predicted ATPase